MRSRAGSQILTQADFPNVLNMTGGIIRWQGHHVGWAEELGLEYFIEGDFTSAVSLAYAMEMGLKQFYQLLAVTTESSENTELLEYMAKLEDGHMAKLKAQYPDASSKHEAGTQTIAEGGLEANDFLTKFGNQLQDVESILQTGMMFEAQAYDMYSRLAQKHVEPELNTFYLQMAAEERGHLKRLAQELEQRIS